MTGRVLRLDAATHKVADVLLPWFVNGTLEADERAFVQAHVDQCPSCRREVEWLREFHEACVVASAEPGAATGIQRLRQHLEAPKRRSGATEWLRSRWGRAQPWSRRLIMAELAVIVALGALLLAGEDRAGAYRTLGAGDTAATVTGNLVVVFDPAATESELRRILDTAGARIVDGPTRESAYVIAVPAARHDQALRELKAQRRVILAESLGPGVAR